MKKLFLSSYAAITLELVKPLLPKPADQLKAAFIPTAGDQYEDAGRFQHPDKEALEKLGMEVTEIDLKTTQGKELARVMQQMDVVLVAGGNTFYLLEWVRKSGFDVIIKKRISEGLVYIGSSAGSILCCPTIEGAKRFDPPEAAPELTDYTGLNLVNFAIIPHTHKEKYKQRIEETTAELQESGLEVVYLTDDQAVVVEGDEWEVVDIKI
jgi:dipeptidase E